jgi:hypothetical protein
MLLGRLRATNKHQDPSRQDLRLACAWSRTLARSRPLMSRRASSAADRTRCLGIRAGPVVSASCSVGRPLAIRSLLPGWLPTLARASRRRPDSPGWGPLFVRPKRCAPVQFAGGTRFVSGLLQVGITRDSAVCGVRPPPGPTAAPARAASGADDESLTTRGVVEDTPQSTARGSSTGQTSLRSASIAIGCNWRVHCGPAAGGGVGHAVDEPESGQ